MPVPLLLPDYGSTWYKTFQKVEDSISSSISSNLKTFRQEIDKVRSIATPIQPIEVVKIDDDDDDDDDDGDSDSGSDSDIDSDNATSVSKPVTADSKVEWDLLGMRAYKIENNNEQCFNILTKPPIGSITVADFEGTLKAQHCYKYAHAVQTDKASTQQSIADVKAWLETIPKQPIDKSDGFKSGVAKDFVNKKKVNHMSMS